MGQPQSDVGAVPKFTEQSQTPGIAWEQLSKSATFVAVLCYVVGVLTVNSYLFRLGFSELSPLKLRFVYTGALALAFAAAIICTGGIGLACVLGEYANQLSTSADSDYGSSVLYYEFGLKSAMPRLLRSMGILLLVLPVLVLVLLEFIARGRFHWSDPLLAAGIYCGVSVSFFLIYRRAWERGRFMTMPLILVTVSVSAGVYLSWFGTVVYPLIPEQFGGGRPKQCRILLVSEAASGVEKMGIPNANSLTSAVSVLYDGDEWLILRNSDGQVLSLDKKSVRALQPLSK